MIFVCRICKVSALKRIWLLMALTLMVLGIAVPGFTQNFLDRPERPPRTSEVVDALDNTRWRTLEPGLDHIAVWTALGVKLSACRISSEMFSFSVVQQNVPNGETAASFAIREDAVIVINGGFFAKGADGKLRPVGLLVDDGVAVSSAWTSAGGYLGFAANGLFISPSRDKLTGTYREIIQSKPVVIEAGKRWALGTNLGNLNNRTLVCLLDSGQVVLIIVSGQGLSLFEAGWLLRDAHWGGWFDCDSAIAFDGGGSTQLYVADHREMAIEGFAPVQNALVVKRKQSLQK